MDLRRSLYISGLLHITAKIAENLSQVLSFWPWWIVELKEVTRMLQNKFSKQRLLTTCFSRAPHIFHRHYVESFQSSVYEGRWNSVLAAVGELIEMMQVLIDAWDVELYTFKSRGRADETGDPAKSGIKVEIVNQAIASNRFWSACFVVDFLGEAIIKIGLWSEVCPCHTELRTASGSSTGHGNVPW